MVFNKKLGKRIKELRDSFNLSQEVVAKKLGISSTTFRKRNYPVHSKQGRKKLYRWGDLVD